jgi:membrane associated rhomboid family serine protease
MFPLKDTQPSYSRPLVTVTLIILNVLAFLFELSLDPYSRNDFLSVFGVVPDRLYLPSLLTSMFLHGGWMHILGNMWFLWIFGDNVEDILGHGRFLLFYLLCGFAAAITQVFLNPESHIPIIGASGAIAGVMGAYMVKFPHARILTLVFLFFFVTTVDVPAVFMLAYWFLIQLFSGVGTVGYSSQSQGGVAWFAHVGGFLVGMLLVGMLAIRKPYSRRSDLRW